MSNNTAELLAEESADIVEEIFKRIQKTADEHGQSIADAMVLSVIRNVIFVTMYDSMINADQTQGVGEDALVESVRRAKSGIQLAIADGFEAATFKYTGKDLGYYCMILTAGSPQNNLLN